jgi:hypothetical protein
MSVMKKVGGPNWRIKACKSAMSQLALLHSFLVSQVLIHCCQQNVAGTLATGAQHVLDLVI